MQLDKNAGIMAMNCFRQTLKAFNRIIAGKRKLVIFTRTVYIIDTRDLCDDQTGASLCPLFIKTDKCICGFSARRPDPDTHCSHDKAVLCFNASDLPFFRDLNEQTKQPDIYPLCAGIFWLFLSSLYLLRFRTPSHSLTILYPIPTCVWIMGSLSWLLSFLRRVVTTTRSVAMLFSQLLPQMFWVMYL